MQVDKCPCDNLINLQNKSEKHDEKLTAGEITMALISKDIVEIKKDIVEIKADLKEIKDKPQKRWDTIFASLISGAITLIIGFLMYNIGIKM